MSAILEMILDRDLEKELAVEDGDVGVGVDVEARNKQDWPRESPRL